MDDITKPKVDITQPDSWKTNAPEPEPEPISNVWRGIHVADHLGRRTMTIPNDNLTPAAAMNILRAMVTLRPQDGCSFSDDRVQQALCVAVVAIVGGTAIKDLQPNPTITPF